MATLKHAFDAADMNGLVMKARRLGYEPVALSNALEADWETFCLLGAAGKCTIIAGAIQPVA